MHTCAFQPQNVFKINPTPAVVFLLTLFTDNTAVVCLLRIMHAERGERQVDESAPTTRALVPARSKVACKNDPEKK